MNIGLEKLNLSEADLKTLKARIELHMRFSRISFTVKRVDVRKVIISVKQGDSFHENQFDAKRLREIGKETFGDMVGNRSLNIGAAPPKNAPTDVVNAEWIQSIMSKHKIKLKNIHKDTGVYKTTLTGYINGTRTLSQPVKAMFYYYFKANSYID